MGLEGGGHEPTQADTRCRRLVRCEAAGADEVDANSIGASEAAASSAVGGGSWLW